MKKQYTKREIDAMKGPRPHRRPGRLGKQDRQRGALERLEAVSEPNERQKAEIETLKERLSAQRID